MTYSEEAISMVIDKCNHVDAKDLKTIPEKFDFIKIKSREFNLLEMSFKPTQGWLLKLSIDDILETTFYNYCVSIYPTREQIIRHLISEEGRTQEELFEEKNDRKIENFYQDFKNDFDKLDSIDFDPKAVKIEHKGSDTIITFRVNDKVIQEFNRLYQSFSSNEYKLYLTAVRYEK